MRNKVTLVVLGALIAFSSRGGAKQLDEIQNDVDEVKRQVYELRRLTQTTADAVQAQGSSDGIRTTLADLNQTLEALRAEVGALRTQLQDLQGRQAALVDKIDLCARGAAAAPHATPAGDEGGGESGTAAGSTDGSAAAAAVVPAAGDVGEDQSAVRIQTLYQSAYGDFIKDNFDLALQGFSQLVATYPQSDLADNSLYWMGEIYRRQSKFPEAIQAYDRVLKEYPQGEKVPDAMVRKAYTLFDSHQPAQAVVLLHDVVERYPATEAARQAKEKLKSEGFE